MLMPIIKYTPDTKKGRKMWLLMRQGERGGGLSGACKLRQPIIGNSLPSQITQPHSHIHLLSFWEQLSLIYLKWSFVDSGPAICNALASVCRTTGGLKAVRKTWTVIRETRVTQLYITGYTRPQLRERRIGDQIEGVWAYTPSILGKGKPVANMTLNAGNRIPWHGERGQ